jgi:hypothetical protein
MMTDQQLAAVKSERGESLEANSRPIVSLLRGKIIKERIMVCQFMFYDISLFYLIKIKNKWFSR